MRSRLRRFADRALGATEALGRIASIHDELIVRGEPTKLLVDHGLASEALRQARAIVVRQDVALAQNLFVRPQRSSEA